MGIRTQLRSLKRSIRGRRWTVRKDKKGFITEVKMIFNPDEYIRHKMQNQCMLIKHYQLVLSIVF